MLSEGDTNQKYWVDSDFLIVCNIFCHFIIFSQGAAVWFLNKCPWPVCGDTAWAPPWRAPWEEMQLWGSGVQWQEVGLLGDMLLKGNGRT